MSPATTSTNTTTHSTVRAIVKGASTFDEQGLNEVEVALFTFVDGREVVSKEGEIELVIWVSERNGAALVLIVIPLNVDNEVPPDQG